VHVGGGSFSVKSASVHWPGTTRATLFSIGRPDNRGAPVLRDLRHAVRSVCRWRFGAVTAVLTLAIGIGTATGLYALLHAVLSDAQIEEPATVGRIYASSVTVGVERAPLSLDDFQMAITASSFEAVAAYTVSDTVMATGAHTATVSAGQVSAEFFAVLRTRNVAGRLLNATDVREDAPVVVVSDRIWRTYFGKRGLGDAAVTLDGISRTIVGILPPQFGFPFIGIDADIWVPMRASPGAAQGRVSVIGRIKSDTAWAAASAELASLARTQNSNGLWTWTAIPVQEDVRKRTGSGLAVMLGPALLVLLIGCVNVACMLFARGIERDVELSVRAALGATRGRVMRELIAESLVLATVGGSLGCAIASGMLKVIAVEMAQFQPAAAARVAGDTTLLPIAFGFSVIACVLFGTLPAVRLSRHDISLSLKGGPAPARARFVGYHARDVVVFVELGLAVVLLVVAGMWLTLFAEMRRVTPQFPADEVVAVRLPSPEVAAVVERVASLPGVRAVAVSSHLPGGRSSSAVAQVQAAGGRTTRAAVIEAGPSFFQTLGLPILRGRSFDVSEMNVHASVVIISQSAAAALWPAAEPLGARLTITQRTGTISAIVIGVCRDGLSLGSLTRAGLAPPDIYLPFDTRSSSDVLLLARAVTDAHALVRPIGEAVRPSPAAAAPRVSVIGDEATFVPPDSVFLIRLIAAFGLVALLLAATGIFGVVSQSVAQRTNEFGLRMALGATTTQILGMVVAREARLIIAATVTGGGVTVVVTKVAFAELVTISGTDPWLWTVVVGLCGGVAATAVTLATYRILRLDPWVVLRRI
jgi:putative ABC transport system permease protein